MELLSSTLNLLIGFVVVMAGVSMIVSLIVGALFRLDNRRSRQLAEMLAAASYAFRTHHGDYGAPDDAATAAFVRDVMSDAVLQSASDLERPPAARPRRPIEWIAKKDLIEIVERNASNGQLPTRWYTRLRPEDATDENFVSWLHKWFATIESNATDRFRRESGRLVLVVSAIGVVLLNLDAVQLTYDLFAQSALANALSTHAAGVVQMADRADVNLQTGESDETLQDLVQLNAILNLPELRLGWQRSTFVERYCAYSQRCSMPVSLTKGERADSGFEFWLYAARWLGGLVVSIMLLFMGAPFWADRLRDLLRLRSSIQQNHKPVAK